jgi:putative transposase
MWCSPGYIYYPVGEQKRLEQTKKRGRRLSIIGLFQPLVSFIYGLVIGSINSKSYIKMMENEAIQAEQELKANGRIRVIVQDNGSIHKSLEVREYWTKWESLGLYIFFLPKYCSEMNRIELEWQQLKKHEISGQIFDDEIDL